MEKHIKAPISKEVSRKLRAGDYVYITGTIYTAKKLLGVLSKKAHSFAFSSV